MPFWNYYLGVQCNEQEPPAKIWDFGSYTSPENTSRAPVIVSHVSPRDNFHATLVSHVSQATASIAPYNSPVI